MLNERNTLLEDDGIEEEILVEEECSVAQAVWGDIQGNIENQTDLQNALDAKQDQLTEAQLNAVNSGITAGKVATYDGYADQIASKADQSALNAESVARGEADTALGTRIDDEATARQNADNGLQSQIDAITSKSDVVDVVANYAALQAYDTSTLDNNDVIKVLDDETHEDALTYYRWSTTTQTWAYIGQEAPYYSKGQMDVMLQGKQNTLTAGANVQISNDVISATDTTYTAGNGLDLNGTEFSADTDILATKEDLEDYYTKPETDNLLAPKLEAEVVAELPATGEEGKLYLTPKAHTTQTATGNPITATVTEEAGAIESFQLDGDTFQQTYTGKNLLDIAKCFGGGINGNTGVVSEGLVELTTTSTSIRAYSSTNNFKGAVTEKIPVNAGDKVTLSWERGNETTQQYACIFFYDANDTFLSKSAQIDGYTTLSVTATAPSNVAYARCALEARDVGTAVTFYNPMLEKSASATSYEPYVGETPSPNPEYPQPIQTVTGEQAIEIQGKNLNIFPYASGSSRTDRGVTFTANPDGSVTIKGTHDGSGTAMYYFRDFWSYNETNGVIVNANTTITASITGGGEYGIRFIAEGYYSDGTYEQFNTTSSQAITTVAKATFNGRITVYAGFSSTEGVTVYPMLEKGSTATSFEPYSRKSCPINLGSIELCKLGGYQDYIWKDGEDWKVHKATATYTLNGTESWNETATGVPYTTSITDYALSSNTPMSAYFIGATNRAQATTLPNNTIGFNDTNSAVRLWVKYLDKWSTGASIAAWLAQNPATIYYALRSTSQTDTTITNQTLIAQLEAIRTASLENGANTITNSATDSNLAGDMEIGYYGFNPRNRYDKWLWLDINNEYEQIGS